MKQQLPLAGYKVVELATVVAVPVTARMFADYGADVYKVEVPPAGDLLRPTGRGHTLPAEEGNNPLFDMYNIGKNLIALNLKTEEGKEIFFQLLSDADVFVTNIRMQSLKKMGIDYDSLKERFPKLVYGHFSGFGVEGEEVNRPGFDQTAFWFRSGAATDIGTPGSFPVRASFGFGDITTAGSFMNGLLMALLARERTQHGTFVATSLQRAAIWCSATAVINSQPQYGKVYPVDRYSPWDPFSDFYCCGDGEWVAFMEKKYENDRYIFARIFDLPELIEDPDLESLDAMRDSGKLQEVTHKLEKIMKSRPSDEWIRIFEENDVACEKGRHFKDAYKDPQARANGAFEDVEYPDGVTAMPTPPLSFSEYTKRPFQKAGPVGQDTDRVLEKLGYDPDTIAALREKNVLI